MERSDVRSVTRTPSLTAREQSAAGVTPNLDVLSEKATRSGSAASRSEGACVPWGGKVDEYGHPTNKEHRRLLAAKLGRKLAKGEVARHTCDNPGCVNPDHIIAGTQLDNIRDREERNRTARGERIPWARLTDGQAENIAALNGVISAQELANVYGVSRKTVHDIWAGRRWNSVTGLPRTRKPIPYSERGEIRRAS